MTLTASPNPLLKEGANPPPTPPRRGALDKNNKNTTHDGCGLGANVLFSGLVPKSKLLHNPKVHDDFVPKHSLHGGKNLALRVKKPIGSTEGQLFLVERSGTVFLL